MIDHILESSIFKRDNYTCHYCHLKCDCSHPYTTGLSIDHIIPKSKGGTDDPDNLVTACCSCNKKKRDKDYNEFVEIINRRPKTLIDYIVAHKHLPNYGLTDEIIKSYK